MPDDPPLHVRLYELILDDEDVDSGHALPEPASEHLPRNTMLNILSGGCSKLAEQLSSPGVVLPWLLAGLGAPTAITGLLVPTRQAGSLLPQMLVSGQVRRVARQKLFWVASGYTQAAALVAMAAAGWMLDGTAAGVTIVGLLLAFSIASGVASVAFKDVMAKTVPKGLRGRVLARRAVLGGALTLGAGLIIRFVLGAEEDGAVLPPVFLLVGAGAVFALATALFGMIREPDGERQKVRGLLKEARDGLGLLRHNRAFRRFIAARGLLLSVPLSLPFMTLYVRDFVGGGGAALALFIVAVGLTTIVASPVFGRVADRSSRVSLAIGGTIGTGACAVALMLLALPEEWRNLWVGAGLLVAVSFAEAAVKLGRKTYLIDGAPDDRRPLYAALANTLIGLLTLAGAGLGIVADIAGLPVLIGLLALLAALGVVASLMLPEAEGLAEN